MDRLDDTELRQLRDCLAASLAHERLRFYSVLVHELTIAMRVVVAACAQATADVEPIRELNELSHLISNQLLRVADGSDLRWALLVGDRLEDAASAATTTAPYAANAIRMSLRSGA